MNHAAILESLLAIARSVFDDDDVSFTLDTPFDDIEEWDSLSHIHMVVRMEKKFSIKFQQAELQNLVRVQDLVSLIAEKTSV
jgi:acyl carrier protein